MDSLNLIKNDPWLEPYKTDIEHRFQLSVSKEKELAGKGKSLSDFADGYLYFGLHKTEQGWVIREWAPNATDIFLIGNFSEWKENTKYRFSKLKNGVWELKLKTGEIKHLDL